MTTAQCAHCGQPIDMSNPGTQFPEGTDHIIGPCCTKKPEDHHDDLL